MINFVSNLPHDLRSGGFSALNAVALAAIGKLGAVHFVGPVNPPVILRQKALSKFLRITGSTGSFFHFSPQRLRAIAADVEALCVAEAEVDLFHGFTPWILTKPKRRYIAWSDCAFRDYIDIYHRRAKFRKDDLDRIEGAEAVWLRNACRVLFTSNWAAGRAVSHYALDASRVRSVGMFGEIEMPARDIYAGGKEFAFVATNFEAKGGPIVLSALRKVRKRHPDASLFVVGDQPSHVAAEPGVRFGGFLRKEVPEEHERFRMILGRIRALVHPTQSDIAPMVLVEAGYFGCPVISSRKFAIPELVDDTETGILLDDPSDAEAVADAMDWMLEHQDGYQTMREAAWAKSRDQHSKGRFEERLLSCVREFVSGDRK